MFCNKASDSIKKEIGCKPIYNKNFDNQNNYVSWSEVLIDFVLRKGEKYYPQVFSKECKYIEKGKKVIRYVTDDLKFSFDESDGFDKE